jgi:hypothetical protein
MCDHEIGYSECRKRTKTGSAEVYSISPVNKKEECLNGSGIHIFRAEKSHGEVLLSLIDALADFERLPRPDSAGRERLLRDAFGEHRRFDVFLAQIGGETVGYAIAFETYSSFLALPTLYLEDLFVLPE